MNTNKLHENKYTTQAQTHYMNTNKLHKQVKYTHKLLENKLHKCK